MAHPTFNTNSNERNLFWQKFCCVAYTHSLILLLLFEPLGSLLIDVNGLVVVNSELGCDVALPPFTVDHTYFLVFNSWRM
jgi:hypothetical protein